MTKRSYELCVRLDFAGEGFVDHRRLVKYPEINTLPNLWHAWWMALEIRRYGGPGATLTIWIEEGKGE